MTRALRSVLVALVVGAGLQRVTGLVSTVLLTRALGIAKFGELAFGLQIGLIIGLFGDSGIRSVATRQASAEPGRAGGWIRAAIRARLLVSMSLLVVFAAAIPFVGGDPVFLLLCAAVCIPASVDLKDLSEVAGVTRSEVTLEAAAGVAYLVCVSILVGLGITDLRWHAAAVLASRAVYGAGALLVTLRMPAGGPVPSVFGLVRSSSFVSVAQAAHGLVQMSDLVLLRLLSSPYEVGLFAAARRISVVAEAPAALLSRAVQPHLHHAAQRGDAAATLRRALAIAAYASVPIAVGGWVLAEPLLVRLSGAEWAAAAPTLCWLLATAVVVAVGSRFGALLFSFGRIRAFAVPLLFGATLNLVLTVLFIPAWGAQGSACASLIALTVIVTLYAVLLRRIVPLGLFPALARPLAVAALVGAAAWALPATVDPLLRVLAGGLVFAVAVWRLEGRAWSTLGAGLHAASGLPAGVAPAPATEAALDVEAESHDAAR